MLALLGDAAAAGRAGAGALGREKQRSPADALLSKHRRGGFARAASGPVFRVQQPASASFGRG